VASRETIRPHNSHNDGRRAAKHQSKAQRRRKERDHNHDLALRCRRGIKNLDDAED
jgi:hypothetical protein